MDERGNSSPAPILYVGIGVEDFRLVLASPRIIQRAFFGAAGRVALFDVCEWE